MPLSSIFLYSGPFLWVIFRSILTMVPCILWGDHSSVYSIDEIYAAELSFENFHHSQELYFSIFFFHLCCFDGVRFQYSKVLVSFHYFKSPDMVLIWQLYSFHWFSFTNFNYKHKTFVNGQYHSSILSVYSYFLYRNLSSYSFFSNSLMLSVYIRWLSFLMWLFLNLLLPVNSLRMWLSGIIVIKNSKRKSVSPWKMSLRIINDILLIRVFHTSVSWCFYTGVWVTASFLMS